MSLLINMPLLLVVVAAMAILVPAEPTQLDQICVTKHGSDMITISLDVL